MPVRKVSEDGSILNGMDPVLTDYAVPSSPKFNAYLVSPIVYLGKEFGENFKGIGVIYDLEMIMQLEEELDDWFPEEVKAIKDNKKKRNTFQKEFRKRWTDLFERESAIQRDDETRLSELLDIIGDEELTPHSRLENSAEYLKAFGKEVKPITDEESEEYTEAVEVYRKQLQKMNKESVKLNTALGLKIISKIVLQIVWPWDEEDRPIPTEPDSFSIFGNLKDRVIYWISAGVLGEVKRKHMTGPLFMSRYSATTIN